LTATARLPRRRSPSSARLSQNRGIGQPSGTDVTDDPALPGSGHHPAGAEDRPRRRVPSEQVDGAPRVVPEQVRRTPRAQAVATAPACEHISPMSNPSVVVRIRSRRRACAEHANLRVGREAPQPCASRRTRATPSLRSSPDSRTDFAEGGEGGRRVPHLTGARTSPDYAARRRGEEGTRHPIDRGSQPGFQPKVDADRFPQAYRGRSFPTWESTPGMPCGAAAQVALTRRRTARPKAKTLSHTAAMRTTRTASQNARPGESVVTVSRIG
jgi:hypothetical protein